MKPKVILGLLALIVLVSVYLFREGYTNPPSTASSDNSNPGASAAWAAQNAAMNAAAVAAATGTRSTGSTTAARTTGSTASSSTGGTGVSGTQQAATTAAAATPSSASRTTTDASGAQQNMIALSLVDLIKALSFSNKTGSPDDALKPPVFLPSTNVLPFPLDSSGSSVTLSEASEKRITSDILKTLKDQLLAERATAPVNADTGCSGGAESCGTDSCHQGAQYASNQASGVSHDPNDYIRKDKIPCWGCQLAGSKCNLSH